MSWGRAPEKGNNDMTMTDGENGVSTVISAKNLSLTFETNDGPCACA